MSDPDYGETLTYESIVGALPGIDLPTWLAVAIQFAVFQGGVLVLAAIYDLWDAVPAATVAVVVAAVGSVEMVRISRLVRQARAPDAYRRLLFGSSIEVVLAVLAYVALLTHLFVYAPRQGGVTLLERLLGPEPPVVVVYLLLLILWDVCYRIGAGWWASVAALWRSARYAFDPETARSLQRADLETMAFGLVQLVLVPFVLTDTILLLAIVGHVVAVTLVTGVSVLLCRRHTTSATTST